MKLQQVPTRRPRNAFTLIELLVVVSIIALLVAIILPALGKAKLQASKVVCGTRIRGLGTAMLTYLSEYDNTFPINGVLMPKAGIPQAYTSNPKFSTAAVTDPNQWRLEYGALWPIMGGTVSSSATPTTLPMPQGAIAKAYLCPDDTLTRTGTNSSTPPLLLVPSGAYSQVQPKTGSPGFWSYSVNAVCNSLGRFRDYFGTNLPWIDPLKTTEIQKPSDFLVFIEEDNASPFNDEVFDAPAFGGGDRLTNRHNNGGNVGYADGHVEWVSEVAFDHGGGNPPGTSVAVAMQSPWTSQYFPDPGNIPTGP